MSEKKRYRTFTREQKLEIVLAGLRSGRTVRDICREYEIAEALCCQWRDRLSDGGKAALATSRDEGTDPRDTENEELREKVAQLERALGRKTYESEVAGELLGLDVSVRVSKARAVVAHARRPAVVARVAGISRQAIYRPITRRPAAAGPGRGRPGDDAIVEVAEANPTDGTRMVAALASAELGVAVNRERAQRIMRAHTVLQPTRSPDRRRRPGYVRVTRPGELWPMNMTTVWTAQHGWVHLHGIIDCCTREITGWRVDLRTRAGEAIGYVEAAVIGRAVPAGVLTLGTDNGSPFTAKDFRTHLPARGVTHRRGGYRDAESQAFIESWFGQFKKRCARRAKWDTLDQASKETATDIDTYHHRPHSGLAYRTPTQVAQSWRDHQDLHTEAT